MSKLVTPILATVEHVTGVKEGEYGPYRSVLFLTENEEKIWKSFKTGSPELTELTPRTKVRLIQSGQTSKGKPSHVIELVGDSTPTPAPGAGLEPDQKRAIAHYIEEQAALYAFCFGQAQEKMGEVSEETVRCAASSLYISAQRKFKF